MPSAAAGNAGQGRAWVFDETAAGAKLQLRTV